MVLEMPIKAILFDFYLTIVDIKTDERKDHLWQVLASFLQYRGAAVKAAELREIYLHDVKVDLTQLRGLDRGSSILEEGGQDLPEVVLPFVGFDIDDGQVEVKQDRLDRHLEDHSLPTFGGASSTRVTPPWFTPNVQEREELLPYTQNGEKSMDGFGKAFRSVDVRLCNFSSSVVVLVEWLARRKPFFCDGIGDKSRDSDPSS